MFSRTFAFSFLILVVVTRGFAEAQPARLALAFAANSYVSAESLFGHLFLVDKDPATPYPLWKVYEFSVTDIIEKENFLEYLYKGIGGGFSGSYKTLEFYEKLSTYGDLEQRNIWLYDLKLGPAEERRVRAEISKSQKKPYYFFTQNCATEILKTLAPQKRDWVWSPGEVLKVLDREEKLGDVQVFEPIQSQLARQYQKLSSEGRSQVRWALQASEKDLRERFSQQEFPREGLRFLQAYYSQKPDAQNWHSDWFQKAHLLAKIRQNTEFQYKPETQAKIESPLYSQHMMRMHLAGVFSAQRSTATTIGFRPALQSLTDNQKGQSGYRELELFDVSLLERDGTISLKKLTMFSFVTLKEYDSISRSLSWLFQVRYDKTDLLLERQDLELGFAAGWTKTYGVTFSLLPKVALRRSFLLGESYIGGGALFLLLKRLGSLSLSHYLEYIFWSSSTPVSLTGSLSADYYLVRSWSIFARADWAHKNSESEVEATLGAKFYF